ncbi:MAG: amino acid racemase [Rubrivivax sp.]
MTPRKPLAIGIVGCSAEGAALCYRTICAEAPALLGPHAHPELLLHTPSLAGYARCLDAGDLDGVAALMLESATKLAAGGAQLLICPDNTIHAAFDRVAPRSPLPWLHIAEVVADEAAARGLRCLGLTGTRWLVDSEVYPAALARRGLAWRRPPPAQRELLQRVIMDELVPARHDERTVRALQQVIADLQAQGCDGVVLGCTEIPLVIGDHNAALPTLDSTRLLARAALRRSVAG